ncbi:MAG: B12-binding domain-containing radical SAM protein [Fibrobacterota bacterium]
MKITFLTPPPPQPGPPPERVAGCAYGLYPVPNVFILYAAATALESGSEAVYRDLAIEGYDRKKFRQYLAEDDSGIYAVYSVNLSIETDISALSDIREIRADVPVIFFGPAATRFPVKFCTDKDVTVIRGEPEFTFRELLKSGDRLSREIPGTTCLSGNGLIDNPPRPLIMNPDEIPFPARELVKDRYYYSPKLMGRPFTAALASRNCPHKCRFCVPCSLSFAAELEYRKYNRGEKPPVRRRSPGNIAREFEKIKEQGYRAVSMQDDEFIWGPSWTKEAAKAIGASGVEWGCAARADMIKDDIVRVMAENGCRYIDLGIESFDQRILDDIGKNISADVFAPAVKTIQKHKIAAKVNILIGASPLETPETVRHSMKKVKELGADQVMYNIASPFPGTRFYEDAKKNKWFRYGDYIPLDVQKRSIINYPGLPGEEMEKLLRKGNREFFLSIKFIKENLWRLKSVGHVINSLKSLYRKLRG